MTLGGYSGHADQVQLVRFAMSSKARRVVLVHGEDRSKHSLARALVSEFGSVGQATKIAVP
ncbi:RNA-metabolising metallo-beta-lactamase [compost metagenome]